MPKTAPVRVTDGYVTARAAATSWSTTSSGTARLVNGRPLDDREGQPSSSGGPSGRASGPGLRRRAPRDATARGHAGRPVCRAGRHPNWSVPGPGRAGQVVEQGNHAELAAQGAYADLDNSQFAGAVEEDGDESPHDLTPVGAPGRS